MRGAPQGGFSRDMRRIRSRSSRWMGGRPDFLPPARKLSLARRSPPYAERGQRGLWNRGRPTAIGRVDSVDGRSAALDGHRVLAVGSERGPDRATPRRIRSRYNRTTESWSTEGLRELAQRPARIVATVKTLASRGPPGTQGNGSANSRPIFAHGYGLIAGPAVAPAPLDPPRLRPCPRSRFQPPCGQP
jgi:hypothetical protein